jgi:hypothetical protein
MFFKISRILCFLSLLCFLPFPALAQNITTVNATIVDPNGLPYSNASVQAQLIPTGITPTINGQQVASFTRATADVTGTFSMNLASNAVISPGGTQWQFTVNIAPGISPPAGTGPQQCTVVSVSISGASQSVSSNINAGCPKLSNSAAAGPGANGPSSTFTMFPASSSNCGTYSIGGTTYCAQNNVTGALTSSTDFRALWDGLVAATPNGGHFFMKQGIYNCNSLDTESTGGFSNAYCMAFPPCVSGCGSASTEQVTQWLVEGEIGDQVVDQFGTPVQTSGTIINLTPAAVSSVPLHTKITVLWARKDVTTNVGASMRLKNLGIRVPTNQRGCETESSMENGLNVEYDHVFADTAVAQGSLLFPVQDACTAWGETDPGGLIGLTSVNGSKEHSEFDWSYTMGADVGLDVRGEHVGINQSAALDGNHGIDIGMRGPTISHSSFWVAPACGEVARCLTFGPNMILGSALTVFGFDLEDATAGGYPLFLPVYHFAETNPGATNGLLSYLVGNQNIGLVGIPNLFDGGGGTSFTVLQATSQHNLSRTPGIDTFTRANVVGLGPSWHLGSFSVNTFSIVSNRAQCTTALPTNCFNVFIGEQFPSSDQFAQLTVAAIDANASSNAQVITNASLTADTFYSYFCSGAAATGSGIYKHVTGVQTILASQTAVVGCATNDVIKLYHIGNWLYAYRNGVLDKNFTPNPVTDSSITGGNPGIELSQDVLGGSAATNFIGGNPPTLTGSDSVYSNDAPLFASQFLSIGTAPTVTGTGACATITTQVPAVLGDRGGKFTCTGVTAASTITLTFPNVSPDDHQCNFSDRTTRANVITQTSGSVTTCVATATSITQNDVISWNQEPF